MLPLLAIGYSCRKDPQANLDIGYDYFPGVVGSYIEYNAIEIIHDDVVAIHDTSRYQLKELIAEEIIDLEGRPAFRIERYKRDSSHHVWQIADVWTATKTAQHLEKVEENVKYLRLLFAAREGERWDGNAANVHPELSYEYLSVDESQLVDGVMFENVAHIEHGRDYNAISMIHSEEKYAKHVGLIHKYHKSYTFDNFDTTQVLKGEELYMNYISHGIE